MNEMSERLVAVWNMLVGLVIAPLTMLSVMLVWPAWVQIALTVLLYAAVFAPPLVRKLRRRHR
jgi:hypothetical protein